MKNKIIPVALLLAFPLIGCSTSQVKAANRANEGVTETSEVDGESSDSVVDETSSEVVDDESSDDVSGDESSEEVVTPTESEYVTIFKTLTADGYFVYEEKENSEEDATFTYTTSFSVTSILGETKSLTLNYKEVVKEDISENSEEDKPHHPHHEKRRNETAYEGELVIGENTYTTNGFIESRDGAKKYRFNFEKEEGVKAGLFFETRDNSVSFSYSEGGKHKITSEYTYELIKEDDFTSIFVSEITEVDEIVYFINQFVDDENTYMYFFSYVDEVVTETFGTLTTTDEITTFEEITFDDDFEDEDKNDGDGCCCDCPCCNNHDKDYEDFEDYDDFDDFEDFNSGYYDDDFDDFNDDFEDYHEGGHGKEDNHNGYHHR